MTFIIGTTDGLDNEDKTRRDETQAGIGEDIIVQDLNLIHRHPHRPLLDKAGTALVRQRDEL